MTRAPLLLLLALVSACTSLLDIPDPIDEAGPDSGAPPRPLRRSDLVAAWNDEGRTSIMFHDSTWEGFATYRPWSVRDAVWAPDARWFPGRFDPDELDDLVSVWNDGGKATVTVRRSTGTSFVAEPWAERALAWAPSTTWVAGDVDGDGLTDLVAIGEGTTVTVLLSTGSRLRAPQIWPVHGGRNRGETRWSAGAFAGDDRDDLVVVWNDGGTASIAVLRSTGAAFVEEPWAETAQAWAAATRWLAGDFDGDGGSDVASVWNDDGLVSFDVVLASDASPRPSRRWSTREGGWGDEVHWTTGDVDADGRTDLVDVWNEAGQNTLTVRRSIGSTFAHDHWGYRQGIWIGSTVWRTGVFDAD